MWHMILVGLIIGAVVAFMVTFWKEITEWLQTVIKNVKERNWKGVLYGTKVFLKKVGKKFKRIAEHFSRIDNEEKWLKTTTINEEYVEDFEVPEDRVPDDIRNSVSVQRRQKRRQNISDSARDKIRRLCKTVDVCRENPALIGEFGVDGYDIYLMHANSLNLKYGDGFIITRNGIYCKRWNAKNWEAPSFILFEDIARASIIRYEGKYQFTLIYFI